MRSWATKKPRAPLPTLPVILPPQRGSATVRVKTASIGGQEDVGPFQEERPFFRVIQGVARIDVELGGVGLDLGKVGVDGGVEDQVGGDAPLGGQSGLDLDLSGLQAAVREILAAVAALHGQRGVELEVVARRDVLQAADLVELAEQAVAVAVARDAISMRWRSLRGQERSAEKPQVCLPADLLEAQLVEGDGDLHLVAVGGDPGRPNSRWRPRRSPRSRPAR